MLKIIFNVIKRIIMGIFLLYGVNLMLNTLQIVIPINVVTIVFTSIFTFPGLLSLLFLYFVL